MIYLCPFCGNRLKRTLTDGLSTCSRCSRVFDCSSYSKALSAAWVVYNWQIEDRKVLQEMCDLSERGIDTVYRYVVEMGYSYDDFLEVATELRLDESA